MSERLDKLRGLPTYMAEDFLFMHCAEYLGGGIGRDVFASRFDPKSVIKLAQHSGNQNVIEYEVWCIVKEDKALKPWFAPCSHLSGIGQWLIQARTTPILKKDLPRKVPTIFTDLKPENWGWYDGRPVCHDYGTILCRMIGAHSSRLRVAKWI